MPAKQLHLQQNTKQSKDTGMLAMLGEKFLARHSASSDFLDEIG